MMCPKTHKRKDKYTPRNRKKAVNRGKKRSLQMRNNRERSLSLPKHTTPLPYPNIYLILTRPRTHLRISMQPALLSNYRPRRAFRASWGSQF